MTAATIERRCFGEGELDAKAGAPWQAVPYPPRTVEHNAWKRGWRKARQKPKPPHGTEARQLDLFPELRA